MEGLQLVWGWQPALYLFLGGMGAGAFIVAAALFLKGKEEDKRVANVAMWAAVICVVGGLLLLLSELSAPLRGMLLWQSFSNFTSWMTIGAWVLLVAVAIFAATAILTTDRTQIIFDNVRKAKANEDERFNMEAVEDARRDARPLKDMAICKGLAVAGIVLGACVAVYTGILLMSVPGVPFWKSTLLPCLFTVSALDTGVALVEIIAIVLARKGQIGLSEKAESRIRKAVITLVLLEVLIAAAFVFVMLGGNEVNGAGSTSFATTATASAKLLVGGALAPWFWGLFVACGLAVPLLAAVISLARPAKPSKAITCVGALCALAGGCALRFLVLMAGSHADFIADAMMLIGM